MNGRDLRSQRIESRKADLGVGCSTAAAESGHLAGPLLPDCRALAAAARPSALSRVRAPTDGPSGSAAVASMRRRQHSRTGVGAAPNPAAALHH